MQQTVTELEVCMYAEYATCIFTDMQLHGVECQSLCGSEVT